MPETAAEPARRRRGQELEDALLDAAWEELVAGGYGSFTVDAVAMRAQTSRPVLYRRWTKREDLMLAAIRHRAMGDAGPIPDTGSLRGDVIALLEYGNEHRTGMAALLSAQLGAYYQETGRTPSDVRLELLGGRASSMDLIMQRAIERGEVASERATPRLVTLPFDLFRHEILMTLTSVSAEVIREIVDDVFLPLITRDAPGKA
jgi:AcrR family transcriptional regulator